MLILNDVLDYVVREFPVKEEVISFGDFFLTLYFVLIWLLVWSFIII